MAVNISQQPARIYSSRPCVLIALAFCGGIMLEKFSGLPLWAWPVMAGVVSSLAGLLRGRRWARVSLLFAICACAGAMALRSYVSLPADHVARFIGQEVQMQGRVVSDITSAPVAGRARTSFVLEAREIIVKGVRRQASGRVLVVIFRAAEVAPEDEVMLSGRIRAPSGFGASSGRLSYVDSLAGRKVLAAINVTRSAECRVLGRNTPRFWEAWARFCRNWLDGVLERYLSPGEAGLMKGLIYGERSDIPDHVKNIFLRTGTTHILAVSGLNVAMVALGIFFVLSLLPVPRLVRLVLAMAMTSWYAYVAGGSSPVVRAAVMSAVYMLSFTLEREQDGLNTLAVASLAILVVNPTQLFDIGFQLSFAGVLSLVLIVPLLGGLFPDSGRRLWNEYLGVSIAAFFGTAGIVLYYFGTVTPVSLLANIPAVPLVGVITALGALLFVAGGLAFLAAPVALVLKAALNLLVYSLYLFTLVPGGFFYIDPLPALCQVALYYAGLGCMVWLMKPQSRPAEISLEE
ncbi:MAG: ComEC family competence protein [Candidatus Omnitrophica bacterium]|nr:ComEC family competence protein [Candidatus Omnitrophota bacterium]